MGLPKERDVRIWLRKLGAHGENAQLFVFGDMLKGHLERTSVLDVARHFYLLRTTLESE